MTIDRSERRIMEHATAWRSRSPLYRNYYVAGSDHEAWRTLQTLCERGLMRVCRAPSDLLGGMTTFAVTNAGLEALAAKTCTAYVTDTTDPADTADGGES